MLYDTAPSVFELWLIIQKNLGNSKKFNIALKNYTNAYRRLSNSDQGWISEQVHKYWKQQK